MKKLLKYLSIATLLFSIASCGEPNITPSQNDNSENVTDNVKPTEAPSENISNEEVKKDATVVFLTGIDLMIDAQRIKEGDKVTLPTFEAVPHYNLEGWYLDEEYTKKWDFENDVVGEGTTILYAKWNFEPYTLNIKLPSTHLLEDASKVEVVKDAPELMILEVVYDTSHFTLSATVSSFEYVKIFNNTTSDYNLKNHRLILANPMSGLNGETEAQQNGLEPLVTNYLFQGYIDEDFVIPALSTGLLWLKPYYWTAGSGQGAYNKMWSADIIHGMQDGVPGAMDETIADFKDYWELQNSSIPIYELTNMAIVGKRALAEAGTTEYYPIYSPGSGTMYTHLNSALIRSLEIQKFNDNNGEVTMNMVNKYSELSPEKQEKPDLIYGKECFNVMEIRNASDNSLINGYDPANTVKYFEPICRTNFCGRVDPSTFITGQKYADFTGAHNSGVKYWDGCVGQQYRPPLKGQKVMQWQLPLNELRNYEKYMMPEQLKYMRFSSEKVVSLRFTDAVIKLATDPESGLVDFRRDEIKSQDRIQAACPDKIKAINLTYPEN